MDKKVFYIFLLVSILGFFVLPENCYGEEYQLPETETYNILNSVQQKLINEWINITASPNFSEPEKQVSIFLIRSAIQKKELTHWFEDVPIEYLKEIIKTSASLLINPDVSTIIDKLEKESVKQAVKIAQDWLLQNEIKIANGPLNYTYTSYKGNEQKPEFHYLISYHNLGNNKAEVIVEFYSPNEIEPPQPKGSTVLGLGTSIWDIEEWLNQGNKKLKPFITRIKGQVSQVYGGYLWDKSSILEITFSEPVPACPFEEEPTSFWGKVKKNIKEELAETIEGFKDIFDILGTIKEKIPETSFLTGESSQPLSVFLEEEKLKEAQKNINDLERDIEELSEENKALLNDSYLINDLEKKIDELRDLIKGLEEKLKKISSQELEELEEEILEDISFLTCQKKQSDNPLRDKIIFNEIAWMGSVNSANDEWLELKNISGEDINLLGWQIIDQEENIKIIFDQTLLKNNNLFLLERTDDDSVPNIVADFIYSGALSNNNESLYLFDQDCQLQDEILAEPDWPAGDNSSKKTMERKTNLAWQTSAKAGGTPKAENSQGSSESTSSTATGGSGSSGSDSTPAPVSYPKILISEIQISPIEERFIQLYNPNDQDVDLTDWYIQRKTETGSSWNSLVTSTNFTGKNIQSKKHFLITRTAISSSEIILENLTLTENNTIVIKNPNKDIVDKVGWGNAQDFETAPALNPADEESIIRKWSVENQSYLDTDNNQNDFEIKIHQTEPEPEPEPEPIPSQSIWQMFNANKQHTNISSVIGPENSELEIEEILGEQGSTDYYGSMVIDSNSNIYLMARINMHTGLYFLDTEGNEKGFYEVPDIGLINSWPALDQDLVYVMSLDGLIALDYSAEFKWKFSFDYLSTNSSPVVDEQGIIYLASYYQEGDIEDNALFAIDENGNELWRKSLGYQTEFDTETPAIGPDGTIYVVFTNILYAINPDSSEKWHLVLGELPHGVRSLTFPIVSSNGIIFTRSDYLYAVTPNGETLWSTSDFEGLQPKALNPDETILYATVYPCWGSGGSVFGKLVAIDVLTGEIIWTKDFLNNHLDALVIDAQGNIYIHYGTRAGFIGLDNQGEEIVSQPVESFRSHLILGKEQKVFLPGQDVLYRIKPK